MEGCKHIMTPNKRCASCGKLVYAVETRKCSECKHFQGFSDFPILGEFPICKKHLMVVTRNMRVTYKIEEGTCFEAAEADTSPTHTGKVDHS